MEISQLVGDIAPSSTLAMDTKVKEMIYHGEKIINMCVGEPDIDTPEKASYKGIEGIISKFTKYTDPSGILPLREKLQEKLLKDNNLEYLADDIILSNGGKHSLYNVIMTICNPEDEVIIPAPYWVSYVEQVKLSRAIPKVIYTDESTDFKVTKEALEKSITNKTKAIIINSPSNPTGTVYSEGELRELVSIIKRHNIYIISDEIYEKINYENHISIASLDEETKERTITINGFSKAYGMTGWRLGYLAGPKNVVKGIKKFQGHVTSNINSIAQVAAIGALESNIDSNKELFEKRMKYAYSIISQIPEIECFKPKGAFYLFPNVKNLLGKRFNGVEIKNSGDFCNMLLENYRVAVVAGDGFGAPNNIRISYALCDEELKEGLNKIKSFIKSLERV